MPRSLRAGGVLVVLGFAGAARLPDPVAQLPALLMWTAVATLGWILAWRGSAGARPGAALAWVLGVAAIARGLMLAPAVPLSDDLYRYLWDGRVANAGINPFAHAPDASALEALRDPVVWPRINHPHVPTIYPPVAQLYFRGLAAAAYQPRAPRVAAAVVDLVAVALLAALLRRRPGAATTAAVFGWCPLTVLESAGGGHVDGLGVALLLGALLARERRPLAAGMLLAASAFVKPAAVFLVPAFLLGPRRRASRLLAGAALVSLLWLPYLDAGPRLTEGFRTYAAHWQFNDAVCTLLLHAGLTPHRARVVLGLALAVTSFAAAARWREAPVASGVVLAAMLALSPTVHPWYGVWLVPFLPFLPARLRAGGVALCVLLPIAYVTAYRERLTGIWQEPTWPRAVLWGTVALCIVISVAVRSRAGRGLSVSAPSDGATR